MRAEALYDLLLPPIKAKMQGKLPDELLQPKLGRLGGSPLLNRADGRRAWSRRRVHSGLSYDDLAGNRARFVSAGLLAFGGARCVMAQSDTGAEVFRSMPRRWIRGDWDWGGFAPMDDTPKAKSAWLPDQ